MVSKSSGRPAPVTVTTLAQPSAPKVSSIGCDSLVLTRRHVPMTSTGQANAGAHAAATKAAAA
jgi:hypothetical protein